MSKWKTGLGYRGPDVRPSDLCVKLHASQSRERQSGELGDKDGTFCIGVPCNKSRTSPCLSRPLLPGSLAWLHVAYGLC